MFLIILVDMEAFQHKTEAPIQSKKKFVKEFGN